MNILFIGNSYTYFFDLPQMFEKLCLANGKDVSVHSVTAGGRELHESLIETDPLHQNIVAYMAEHAVDVLFLQEQSCLPAHNHDLFFKGVSGLHTLIHPQRTIMYATWGRQEGSEDLAYFGWTKPYMTQALYDSYCLAAEKIGGDVSPVGLCFRDINEKYPSIDVYDPDRSHPSLYGSSLACVCHYATLFGELPSNYDSLGLDDVIISAIKDIVATFIQGA